MLLLTSESFPVIKAYLSRCTEQPGEGLTLSTHLILALNSVNPKCISTLNTIVQYVFPLFPGFDCALPASGDKSAWTMHSVEKSSVLRLIHIGVDVPPR